MLCVPQLLCVSQLSYLLSRVRPVAARLAREQRGQASAEYALVMLGAAAVALLVVTWAVQSGAIGDLLSAIMDRLRGHVDRT